MKISKSFVTRISGNYQTYEFQTGIELEVEGIDASSLDTEREKVIENNLFQVCKNAVNRDVAAFAAEDSNFRVVLLSRDKELEKAAAIHNKVNSERKSILSSY